MQFSFQVTYSDILKSILFHHLKAQLFEICGSHNYQTTVNHLNFFKINVEYNEIMNVFYKT